MAAAAIVSAFALRAVLPWLALPPCLLRTLTGWPCPTCGGTRAVLALTSLDLACALAYNPLATLATGALVFAGLLGVGEHLLRRPILSPAGLWRRPWLARGAVAALVVANWVYVALTLKR